MGGLVVLGGRGAGGAMFNRQSESFGLEGIINYTVKDIFFLFFFFSSSCVSMPKAR